MEYSGVKIDWLGHSAFRVTRGKTVYIDPYNIKPAAPADVVLITHEHFDHCSPEDVQKVLKSNTVIITTAAAKDKLRSVWERAHFLLIAPGKSYDIDGVRVEAVPAYNTNKFRSPGVPYHPQQNGGVGFVVNIGGIRIYHAGDTDIVPGVEHALKDIDVAMIPVSGTYVMTPEEAATLVKMIRPKLAIPMHIKSVVGTEAEARRFKELVGVSCEVAIL
ncbi:MAG: MBL fold metallo-hydrolase [Candidatus Aenigmatarchaeota archaeon]